MNNAETFLKIYNKVDKILTTDNSTKYELYSEKVRNSTKPIIRQFREQLYDYGDLRNAIVHRPKDGNNYIAEPLDKVVKDFERILAVLENPPKVLPKFQFKVEGAKQSDKLDTVLKIMNENSFSQMPIFDDSGKVVEVINTNTISRWVGRNIGSEGILKENPSISELFEQDIEYKANYKFISRNCDIYEAYSHFTEQMEKLNRNLDVLFITENGESSEKLLGLITVADITKLMS